MTSSDAIIQVVGAGPAGLAAAITLARNGRRVLVHEAQHEVGHRFGGDLQGLENWSDRDDILATLEALGITIAFDKQPCTHGTAFDAWDARHELHSAAPLFYLVERGPGPGSFDSALLAQALALGVEVRFGSRMTSLEGPGILATGPKAADAIAVGYHFETDMADGFWLLLDETVAPQGYAYLLVMHGRGTVKSCMFSDFKQEHVYVERTVERFRRLAGLAMRNPRPHGGVGNFRLPTTALSGVHPLAGELAGFQDTFAGFGLRYAVLSGVMSAHAVLRSGDYDAAWRQAFGKAIEVSVVNRAVYGLLGNRASRWALRRLTRSSDARDFLRRFYAGPPAPLRKLLLPWARRQYLSQRVDSSCNHRDCHCIWCRSCLSGTARDDSTGLDQAPHRHPP
jgi:flavin-dependent dehydrogenase